MCLDFGISWITPTEASRLPNATSAIPHTTPPKSKYIVGLDVFHQLHCLNMVRKALNPAYYPPDLSELEQKNMGMHLGHCIEHLRHAIMCNADISTAYWQWNEEIGKTQADARVVHTCREWESIRE
jgi:hypothetical protein